MRGEHGAQINRSQIVAAHHQKWLIARKEILLVLNALQSARRPQQFFLAVKRDFGFEVGFLSEIMLDLFGEIMRVANNLVETVLL